MTEAQNEIIYFPVEKAPFSFKAGLFHLGEDFGNGAWDKRVFQITKELNHFRENKRLCRMENPEKYYCQRDLSPERKRHFIHWWVNQLCHEYPDHFDLVHNGDQSTLCCKRTNESLVYNDSGELLSEEFAYLDMIDALANQVPEDIALVQSDGSTDKLSLLHLCSPSYWSAKDKIGKSFIEIHKPVPQMEKLLKASGAFVRSMIEKGPYVRFIWSFVTDQRLNHNPTPPPGVDPIEWRGRVFQFDREEPFYLRVERQVTFGFPELNYAAFFIRIHFIKGSEIRQNRFWRQRLIENLQSIDSEIAQYKGLEESRSEMIRWLSSRD